MVTSEVLDIVYDTHGHRILQWNDDILNPASMQEYLNAITRKGAALDNCFCFIDGTVRPISRPGTNQRLLYNGSKRVHAIKFQSLALPNGLIANMFDTVGKYNFTSYALLSLLSDAIALCLAEGRNTTPRCLPTPRFFPISKLLPFPLMATHFVSMEIPPNLFASTYMHHASTPTLC